MDIPIDRHCQKYMNTPKSTPNTVPVSVARARKLWKCGGRTSLPNNHKRRYSGGAEV
jgi:hypothetical protein